MALIKCKECGHMISDKAVKCPKCGCPMVKKPIAPAQPTTVQQQPPEKRGNKKNFTIILLSVALVAVVVGIGLYFLLRGNATNNKSDDGLESEMVVESQKDSSAFNNHEYVDLGLSVKWATCNVGASTPEDYGDYFAWGETKTKAEYTDENCSTWKKILEDISGNPNCDAARANWGGSWRIPTLREIEELKDDCTTEWTICNGVKGYLVTSKKNGNSIFLPAAGYRSGSLLFHEEEWGYYWSSSPYETSTSMESVCILDFNSEHFGWFSGGNTCGRSVRPVTD